MVDLCSVGSTSTYNYISTIEDLSIDPITCPNPCSFLVPASIYAASKGRPGCKVSFISISSLSFIVPTTVIVPYIEYTVLTRLWTWTIKFLRIISIFYNISLKRRYASIYHSVVNKKREKDKGLQACPNIKQPTQYLSLPHNQSNYITSQTALFAIILHLALPTTNFSRTPNNTSLRGHSVNLKPYTFTPNHLPTHKPTQTLEKPQLHIQPNPE